MKGFTVDNISYLGWEFRIEFWDSIYWWVKLNFDKSSLFFSYKEKIYAEVTLSLIVNIDYETLLAEKPNLATIMSTFTFTLIIILQNVKMSILPGIPLLIFTRVKLCKRPEVNSEPTHAFMVWHFRRWWHAAATVLISCSFYQGNGPKGFRFLEMFRNRIYLEIILLTPGTIWIRKLQTKTTKVLICGITNNNTKQFLLALLDKKIINKHNKILSLGNRITYFSLSFIYS